MFTQTHATGTDRPSAVAPEPGRLQFDSVSGFHLIARDPETSHRYAVDVRRAQQLGPVLQGAWRDAKLDLSDRPRFWSREQAEAALRGYVAPVFDRGRYRATWLHLSVLEDAPVCAKCTVAGVRYSGEREVAHAG